MLADATAARGCQAPLPSPSLPRTPAPSQNPTYLAGAWGFGALRRALGSASGWLWGQSHARYPEGSGHEPSSQGRTARRAPDGPRALETGRGAGDGGTGVRAGGEGKEGAETHRGWEKVRFIHRIRKRELDTHTHTHTHTHTGSAPERGGEWRGGRKGEGTRQQHVVR